MARSGRPAGARKAGRRREWNETLSEAQARDRKRAPSYAAIYSRGKDPRRLSALLPRSEASGVPIEMDFWFVHTISEGKVVRVDMFADERDALEAAGLRE
jgi:ketosteroid isomerase-like protein